MNNVLNTYKSIFSYSVNRKATTAIAFIVSLLASYVTQNNAEQTALFIMLSLISIFSFLYVTKIALEDKAGASVYLKSVSAYFKLKAYVVLIVAYLLIFATYNTLEIMYPALFAFTHEDYIVNLASMSYMSYALVAVVAISCIVLIASSLAFAFIYIFSDKNVSALDAMFRSISTCLHSKAQLVFVVLPILALKLFSYFIESLAVSAVADVLLIYALIVIAKNKSLE